MAEIAKDTDLSRIDGAPTPERATVHIQLERCKLKTKFPAWLGGASVEVSSETSNGSPLAAAISTFWLIVAGCLAALVPLAVGASAWVTIGALCLPSAIFLVIRTGFRQ